MLAHALETAEAHNISATNNELFIQIVMDFGHTIGTSDGKSASLVRSVYDVQGLRERLSSEKVDDQTRF